MLTMTADEARLVSIGDYAVHLRIRVTDATGAWVDWTDYLGRNWLLSAAGGEDIDTTISTLTLTFTRNDFFLSLAPDVTASRLNKDAAGSYSPAFDVWRQVEASFACTAWGAPRLASGSSSWRPFWKGYVKRPTSTTKGPVTLNCMSQEYRLRRGWVETPLKLGSDAGTNLETVIQSALNSTGFSSITLSTPVSPGWAVKSYTAGQTDVLSVVEKLVEQRGWSIGFVADGAGNFPFTLYQRDRTKTMPDFTFYPSGEIEISDLAKDVDPIRNAIGGAWFDRALGQMVTATTITDGPSIAKYDRAYAEYRFGKDSPIGSSTEFGVFAAAALADQKEPKAERTCTRPGFPWVQCGDLYRFKANDQIHDSDLDLAVTSYTWQYDARQGWKTTLNCRGSVAAAYRRYIGYESRAGKSATDGEASITNTDVSYNGASFTVQVDGGPDTASLYYQEFTGGSWGAETLIASARSGSFTDTCSLSAKRVYRVIAKNGAGTGCTPAPVEVNKHVPPPPSASIRQSTATAPTRDTETVTLDGSLGTGDTNRQWRRRTDTKVGTGTFTSWSTSALPVELAVPRDGIYPCSVVLEVKGDAGVVSTATYTVQAGVNFIADDGYTLATGTRATSDFKVGNAGVTFPVGRHATQVTGLKDGDTVTWPTTFESTPQVAVFLARGKTPAAGNRADVSLVNVTTTGAQVRAKEISGGSSTAYTEYFAPTFNGTEDAGGIAITSQHGMAYTSLDNANTTSTEYREGLAVNTTALGAGVTLFVNIYYNTGPSDNSSWQLAGTRTYASGLNIGLDEFAFTRALGANYDIRIEAYTSSGTGIFSVTAKYVKFNAITGGTETAIAELGTSDSVIAWAWEVV